MKLTISVIILSLLVAGAGLAQEQPQQTDPKIDAQKAYNEGLTSLKRNQKAEAIAKFNEAIDKDPDLVVAYYALGIAHKSNNDYSQAEAMFKKAIDKDESYEPAYNALGLLYSGQKRYELAINTFKAALGIDPENYKANFGLGYVYLQQKDYRNAIQYFQQAVETRENYAKAWENLGIAQHEIRQYSEAVDAFSQALQHEKRRTEKADIYLRIGNSLAKLGRDDDAISAYNDALSTATKSYIKGAANFGLGEIYKKNGNTSQAIAHFEAASRDRSWKQSALYELDLLKK